MKSVWSRKWHFSDDFKKPLLKNQIASFFSNFIFYFLSMNVFYLKFILKNLTYIKQKVPYKWRLKIYGTRFFVLTRCWLTHLSRSQKEFSYFLVEFSGFEFFDRDSDGMVLRWMPERVVYKTGMFSGQMWLLFVVSTFDFTLLDLITDFSKNFWAISSLASMLFRIALSLLSISVAFSILNIEFVSSDLISVS